MGVKISLLIVFFITMVVVGMYARKHASSVDGFVLGGRTAGPWLTAFGYGTSYFSAVVFVGYAGQFGWKYGLASTWIGIGNACIGSLLAWVVLGRRTRVMTQHLNAKTMPDFFGKRYQSMGIKNVAAMIVFIFLIPYTASIYNGLSRLFAMAFDIPYAACIIGMAVFTALYVTMGGYMATAINDMIQGVIMLVGIVAVIVSVLQGKGGFSQAIMQLAEIPSDVPVTMGQQGAFTSFFGTDPLNLLGVIVLTSLGTWGLPQMIGKFYAIRDEQSIKAGTVISTVFAIVVAGGCYFLGGFGRLFDDPSLHHTENGQVIYDAIIPHMLSTLSDLLVGVVIVLVLSASMSTLASLVLTSSSTLTLDLLKGNICKNMKEKSLIRMMQGFIIIFIVISVVIALKPSTFIAQLMGVSWGALAGAFLAPFLYGLYWKGVTPLAVWACFLSGVGITVSNIFIPFIASPINAGAISMLVGLMIVPVVSLVSPKMEKKKVEDIFSCLNEQVISNKKHSLEK